MSEHLSTKEVRKYIRSIDSDPSEEAPTSWSEIEERHLLQSGGEIINRKSDTILSGSGHQITQSTLLCRCSSCQKVYEKSYVGECSSCSKVVCRGCADHLEVTGTKQITKNGNQFTVDVREIFCKACWRKERRKRALKFIGSIIAAPFTKGVTLNEQSCPTID